MVSGAQSLAPLRNKHTKDFAELMGHQMKQPAAMLFKKGTECNALAFYNKTNELKQEQGKKKWGNCYSARCYLFQPKYPVSAEQDPASCL